MKKVLADPTAVKTKINGDKIFSFAAPTKDFSHSGCITAGNYYGVGHRQPIGTMKVSNIESGPIPQKAVAFSPDEIFYGIDKRG